ncbi:SNARE-interacting protein KEULE-like isoform X1 [Rutidosis leptorrhynchoides]|uniref:SNARE-interacting protein KEULE-like isoform X1 n=1 Tax=Rutidosis leptorrhynchoides TaxID=125765 RepID=UPI003A99C9DA
MSMSDSDTSSQGGNEYKNFRQITRDRLLYEMLRSAKRTDAKSNWKVLIMDKVTVKIMSCSCKMADITDEGVSLVEDINKRRQPLPTMDAVYYIQPTRENVVMLVSDMAGKTPLYKDAYVYFSSSVPRELVNYIKKEQTLKTRLRAMKEMNLEYFAIDSQCFITDNTMALEELYGNEEMSRKGDECLNLMANRIATVFASLLEFPYVRYRAAKSLDPTTMTTIRDLIPTKLAAAVWNCLMKYKSLKNFNFPQTETCELLILDRSIDQIAPIIHEWTYDAMCHDLLNMDGNKYVHEVASKTGGLPEKKEVLLEDHDSVWLELRHSHIADASERLHDKMTSFVSKNKAAQMHGSRGGSEFSTRDLQKMVHSLPQYTEQIDKLSLHVDIAAKINSIIRESGLKEVGQLEQDLVFGDAGTKEVINFLRTKPDAPRENKLRLLMIYAATHPDKFESDKLAKLIELARIPADDMNAVYNMRFLEGSSDVKKNLIGAFSLKFDVHKKKHGLRKDRAADEQSAWQLSRFYPIIEELIEKLIKNELPKNDYPCMNDPAPTFHGRTQSESARMVDPPSAAPAHSMRSRRTATWARPRDSEDGYSSDSVLRHASSDFKKMGRRVFVFIVGGATRSELRVCHKLTTKLKREVVLGSSSLDDPTHFITKLKLLTANELSLDDLEI